LVARFGAGVVGEIDGSGALAAERAPGGEQDGDLGGGCRVERRLAMELLETRERSVDPELDQIDGGDDGATARGEVAELAANAGSQGGAGQLGCDRGLAAQDLELGEIELRAQRSELVTALAARPHDILQQRGGQRAVAAAACDERARGE